MEILPPKYQKYRMFPQLQQNDENEQMQKALADPSSENLAAPLLRETVTIMINGTPTQVYKDEIEKQLYSQLYSGLGLKFGS